MKKNAEYYQALETASRKKDMLHPDLCFRLEIRGAGWAVRPRGFVVAPEFSDGRVKITRSFGCDEEADEIVSQLLITKGFCCPLCGKATSAVIEINDGQKVFLEKLFLLARKLLLEQYNLSDSQISQMLVFEGAVPKWVGELLKWCGGLKGSTQQDEAGGFNKWARLSVIRLIRLFQICSAKITALFR